MRRQFNTAISTTRLAKGGPRPTRTSVRNSGILRRRKGSSIERHGDVKQENRRWPSSLKRRSRYVPAGRFQNCGLLGISPKSWERVNGKRRLETLVAAAELRNRS